MANKFTTQQTKLKKVFNIFVLYQGDSFEEQRGVYTQQIEDRGNHQDFLHSNYLLYKKIIQKATYVIS